MTRFLLPIVAFAIAAPALAQDPAAVDRRIGKLESEMRAVQRRVFPGADKRFFEPEVAAPTAAPAETVGTPASSPVADLTARVDSLERQLRDLTGQIEQQGFRVRQVEEAFAKYRADTDYRLTAIEGGGTAALPTLNIPATAPATATAAATPPAAAPKPAAAKPETAAAAPPADLIEAAYQAAYIAYSNKQYEKAEADLAAFVAKNPRHARASHAQFWLGRTYLAKKEPAQAAKAFLDNYRNNAKGARAPDSLLWLGQSLMALSPPQPTRACEVYAELDAAFGTKLSQSLKDQLGRARTAAKCG
jgi:TolA-binding protein